MASLRIRKVLNHFRASSNEMEPVLDQAQAKAHVRTLIEELLTAEVVKLSKCHPLEEEIITEEGILALARAFQDAPQSRRLKDLSLDGNKISDDGFRVLARAMKTARLESLKVLDLSGNRITTNGAHALGQALKFLPVLHTLRLQSNPIGVEGLKALTNSFAQGHVPNLKELRMGDVSLEGENSNRRGEGLTQLTSVLASGRLVNLEILDLWHVGDAGVCDLMRAFQSPKAKVQLKSLFLWRNSVGLETVQEIELALKCRALSSLRELSLNGNTNIGDDGVLILAEAFKSNNMENLEHLSLSCTSMGEIGMAAMAKLLEQGYLPSLEHLDVAHNKTVTEAIALKFLSAYVQNKFLVANLNLDWPTQNLRDSAASHEVSNARVARQLKVLKSEQKVAAIHGKVFLCGEGGAGKTTLRKSLYRSWVASLVTPEAFPTKHEPTRGIEVSHIGDNDVKLAVWDLAGQSEYQVLHSSFLPDLAFADGQATIFVIVCRLNFTVDGWRKQRVHREYEATEELRYWLRYIASSSVKRMESFKRHVVIVLNSFANQDAEIDRWTSVLRDHRLKFGELLDIHPHPFILDVRFYNAVREVKTHLLKKAQDLLRSRTVPRICQEIRKKARDLSTIGSHERFPVMEWKEIRKTFLPECVNERELHAAVEYLHEAGHLIYFREGSLKKSGFPESFVVLDPEWFCKSIVGNLLLTQSMTKYKEVPLRKNLQKDGFVLMTDLRSRMPNLLSTESDIILALLYRLGLIYKQGSDKVFMPALFENDDLSGWDSLVREQWVMGFSLQLKESEITILPVSILRRFQVELAQDKELTDYSAGLSHVMFKMDCMSVLVQFSEDGRDFKPGHSGDSVGIRIDILVKPLLSKEDDVLDNKNLSSDLRRARQVNLAQVVVNKLEMISKSCCPGVQYVRNVIKPWTADEWYKMEERDVSFSVDEVKRFVQEGGLGKVFRNWQVGRKLVLAEDLLCQNDLAIVYLATEQRNELIENSVQQLLGIQLPMVSVAGTSSEFARPLAQTNESMAVSAGGSARSEFYDKILFRMDRRFDAVHEHIAYAHSQVMSGMHELLRKLHAAVDHQKILISKVQSLEMFTIAEKRSSVPRFVYPMRSDPRVKIGWKLSQILEGTIHDSIKLRFLCEAHHKDRSLHEVDTQEGIDLKELKLWLRRLAPCLVWSVKIAFIASKVATNVALPGVSMLFPSDQSIQSALSIFQKCSSTEHIVRSFLASIGKTEEHRDLAKFGRDQRSSEAVRGRAREDLKELLKTLNPTDFRKKVGLTKAALKNSQGAYDDVVWICEPCLLQYQKEGRVEELD